MLEMIEFKNCVYIFGGLIWFVFAVIFLDFLWSIIWAWIDDKKRETGIILNYFRVDHRRDDYRPLLFLTFFIFSPIILFIVVKFYILVLILGILTLMAFGARFARRLNKKYNLHVNDDGIHTGNDK